MSSVASTCDARARASSPCAATDASNEAAAAAADADAAEADASADAAADASGDGGSPENCDGSGAAVSVVAGAVAIDGLVDELLHAASTPTVPTATTNATTRTRAPHRRGSP
ncbi:hypothetical protein ACF9IK_32565 [Kitasatospora hibisci]|uniref:hypothetical protein n=1 Tax=Kitasatospora hibisci TaxID=3369522 RepID=UPI003754C475